MSRQPAGGGSGGKSEDRDLVSASALASLFVCPVCRDYVQPPILQCFQGHIVCSACCRKLFTCPICRTPLSGTIRNLAMENVARMVFFPCKYSRMGCTAQLPHSDQHEHEEVCEFSGSSSAGVPVVAFPLGEMSRQAAGGGNGGQSEARGWVSASALANLFVCHVCRDYVRPPILQCHNGPFICCSCRQKITRCPTGRAPISEGTRKPPGQSQAAILKHSALTLKSTVLCIVLWLVSARLRPDKASEAHRLPGSHATRARMPHNHT
ncbi:hypothetical protein HPB48_016430 [Haemaphysalis longicornis]|uniref:RING-type domain-containing protein n=1 Tax=Haemaphysalis longicornis TaxID=44386 RepID=A0A9J6FD32_HAELO|nr:hypothetical protein HPB48_016430 [Haemaphysalis longicornis]